jgi:hypothetical protein
MSTRIVIVLLVVLVLIGALFEGRSEPQHRPSWGILSREAGSILKAGVVVVNALTRAAIDSICALVATSDPDDPDAAADANNCCSS